MFERDTLHKITVHEDGENESEDDMDMIVSFTVDRNPALLADHQLTVTNSEIVAAPDEKELKEYYSDDFFSIIPSDILSGILSAWLSITDLSHLDVAASSKIGRYAFLNCLNSSTATHFGSKKAYGNDYVLWLNSRNVLIRCFVGNRAYLSDESIVKVKSINDNCFSGLLHLDLQNCVKVKESCVLQILESCKKLKILNLSSCFTSNAVLMKISVCLPSLESLNLMGNTRISDTSMIAVVKNCPCINSLNLSYCNKLTERSYIAICQSLNLIHLRLIGCMNLTDNILLKIAINLKLLKTFDIDNCLHITLSNLTLALKNMKFLESLDLPAVQIFADLQDFLHLLRNCQQLHRLGIRNVSHINFDTEIKKSYPNLFIDRYSPNSKKTFLH